MSKDGSQSCGIIRRGGHHHCNLPIGHEGDWHSCAECNMEWTDDDEWRKIFRDETGRITIIWDRVKPERNLHQNPIPLNNKRTTRYD